MIDSGPAQRARSRYVVVFISDGVPEPRCRQGCEDDRNTCSDGIDNDGDGLIDGMAAMDMTQMSEPMPMDTEKTCEELKRERSLASEEPLPEEMMSTMDPDCAFLNDASKRPDILYGVCNTDREIPDGVYVDMSGRCPAYNQPRQILQRVEEIKTLARIYSVGELVMHTVFLGASQEDIDAICGTAALSFGYESCAAKDLLTEMAKTGGGTFRDVNIGRDDASFLDYDYNSLKTPYHATAFVAYNENAQHSSVGLRADSDGMAYPTRMNASMAQTPITPT